MMLAEVGHAQVAVGNAKSMTHMHTHTHTCTRARVHTHTHTHVNTHTHEHTHTHTKNRSMSVHPMERECLGSNCVRVKYEQGIDHHATGSAEREDAISPITIHT